MNPRLGVLALTGAVCFSIFTAAAWGQGSEIPGGAKQSITDRASSPGASAGVTVPRVITFRGNLRDRSGQPLSGVVGLTFAMYKDQEGGQPLWQEVQNVQLDAQGQYFALLGATFAEGLPIELFTSNEPRWLGVQPQLAGEPEQPRVLLVSVPYALKAADADT